MTAWVRWCQEVRAGVWASPMTALVLALSSVSGGMMGRSLADPPVPFAAYMYNDGNGDPALAGWRPYEIATPSLNGWTFACAYRDTHARIVFLE